MQFSQPAKQEGLASTQPLSSIHLVTSISLGLRHEFNDMEDIFAFANNKPPNTPAAMKSCLDDEIMFDTDGTCSNDSTEYNLLYKANVTYHQVIS